MEVSKKIRMQKALMKSCCSQAWTEKVDTCVQCSVQCNTLFGSRNIFQILGIKGLALDFPVKEFSLDIGNAFKCGLWALWINSGKVLEFFLPIFTLFSYILFIFHYILIMLIICIHVNILAGYVKYEWSILFQ